MSARCIYRRICEVVCTGLLVPVSDPVLDIRADAEVLSKVFENKNLSGVIGKAAIALDCDLLRKEIERAGFLGHCEIICRVSCVWRSVWVCRALCLEPPLIIERNLCRRGGAEFRARGPAVGGPAARLSDLAAAVISNNAELIAPSSIAIVSAPIAGRCAVGSPRRSATGTAFASARRSQRLILSK